MSITAPQTQSAAQQRTPVAQAVAEASLSLDSSHSTLVFADHRAGTAAQRHTIDAIRSGPRMLAQRQQTGAMTETNITAPSIAQREADAPAKRNDTGLPEKLKSGIESLSGISMDSVKVRYNSDKPAQLNALAYAQGTDIHIAPGQEQHLPHETWHVVQQAQGRVQPTMQMKAGVPVNDDPDLEHEADVMGARALAQRQADVADDGVPLSSLSHQAVQRKVGFEFQAYNSVTFRDVNDHLTPLVGGSTVGNGAGFYVEADHGHTDNEVEIVTTAVDETHAGRATLQEQMQLIQALAGGIAHNAPVNALAAGGVHWLHNIQNYHFDVNGHVHFHPQSTVGVRFEKIAELIDYATRAPFLTGGAPVGGGGLAHQDDPKAAHAQQIGWSGQVDQQAFRQAWATGLANARHDLQGASDNAISFAAILYGFAEVTSMDLVPNDIGYAKYFMPFMLRLGLLPHYGTLNQEDIAALQHIRHEVRNMPFLPNNGEIFDPATIQQILQYLGEGQDIQDHVFVVGYGGYAPNGAALGMNSATDIGVDDTGQQRAGAIIELRKLGNDVTPDQLSAFALAAFDLIRAINAPAVVGGGDD